MDNVDLYDIVEHAIDHAFQGKYVINMYQYLKSIQATKRDATEFIESSTAKEINLLILDLDDYLEGGADGMHQQLREGYGHIRKPEARKIRKYLYGILEDAWKYEQEKRPGRKRKTNK
tara:strand:- start:92 stop:445 length:354 start_codon:yes stop_codon:yes gene_type:complete